MDKRSLCDFCGQTFGQRKTLYRHIREVHENNRRLSCGKCGRLFHRPSNLQEHEKRCKY